jgi:hypothetical protein
MASALSSPLPIQHFTDNNGNALTGGKLFTYAAGTTTKLATFTDATATTSNTNPIILNTRGEANVWLSPNTAYKFVLSPSTDTDPPTNSFWTVDNLVSGVFGSGTLTMTGGAINETAATLASSSVTAIGAAPGNYIAITGSTTINAFDSIQAGAKRTLTFSGSPQLTYNGTSMILPGGSSIIAGPGDAADFVSLGAGNWICTNYQRSAQPPTSATVAAGVRNLRFAITTTTTATMTFDEAVVENAIGGAPYKVVSGNLVLNMATTGAGGLDTGAIATSTEYSVYLIVSPSTNTAALLATATNATTATTLYSGSHLPSGYTFSALVGAFVSNASTATIPQFVQYDRAVNFTNNTDIHFSLTTAASPTAITLTNVPSVARSVGGYLITSGTNSDSLSADSGVSGQLEILGASGISVPFSGLLMSAPQTIFYATSNTSDTLRIKQYTF